MEEKGKYGKAWIEGFTKAAMANGADAEETKALLKVAATLEKMRDPEFIEGLSKQAEDMGVDKEVILENLLVKEAGIGSFFNPRKSPILRSIMGMGPAAAAAGAAAPAARAGMSLPLGWLKPALINPVTPALGVYGMTRIQPFIDRNFNRNPMEKQWYDAMELAQKHDIPLDQAISMIRTSMGNQYRGSLSTLGFEDKPSIRNAYIWAQ